MTVTTGNVVVGVWLLAGLGLCGGITGAVWKAWRDGADEVRWWRGAKVWSTCMGAIAIVLGLIAFEKVLREMNEESSKYLNEQFIELKFYTTFLKSVACSGDQSSQQAQNECFDFRNIDNQVGRDILRREKLIPPTNWQRNQNLQPLIEQVTRSFERMNSALSSANEPPLLSLENRARVGFLGLILGTIALSLSIGEATYQWRQAPTSVKRT
jgi:hypothetical protein